MTEFPNNHINHKRNVAGHQKAQGKKADKPVEPETTASVSGPVPTPESTSLPAAHVLKNAAPFSQLDQLSLQSAGSTVQAVRHLDKFLGKIQQEIRNEFPGLSKAAEQELALRVANHMMDKV